MTSKAGAQRNLALYPLYITGVGTYAWLPIFFLYLSDRVSIPEVLALEAIYYTTVVALELPSGYFSDRVGRRATLIIAALALVASYGLFAIGQSFEMLALAQGLLAVGLAFNSGTDTSFHLANLKVDERAEQYIEREARLGTLAAVVGAVAALAGGALGMWDLRLAYLLSGIGALVALLTALGFAPIDRDKSAIPEHFGDTLKRCFKLLRGRVLGWVFAVSVVSTILTHVPYEFYQPYLEELPQTHWPKDSTPLVAGIHAALVKVLEAPAARYSARLSKRLGLTRHLMLSVTLQVILIAAMTAFLHPAIAILLLARSVPYALQEAPIRAAVAPRVAPRIRATYLSMQSLAGRLGFALLLILLANAADERLSVSLNISAVVAVTLLIILGMMALLQKPDDAS